MIRKKDHYKGRNLYKLNWMKIMICIVTVFVLFTPVFSQIVLNPWGNHNKRIVGDASPIHNIYPFTTMTNQLNGVWQYSCYYIPGQTISIKFIVNTNTNIVPSKYIYEIRDPRDIEITFGTQGRIYITNTPAGLMRVTEGTGINNYMLLEFNWEDDPDPPTGIYADVNSSKADVYWTKSLEMDVIGYNIYLSNNFYPYYRKINSSFILTNYYRFTNLPSGSTNYIYITAVDAYTNMPNFESPKSSIVFFIADKMVEVVFYLNKPRAEVPGSIYIGGEPDPLNWEPSRELEYLYNDIWTYHALFMKGSLLKYKYNIDKDSSKWESDFNTSSKNREIVVSDTDNDGVMVINDSWDIETIINPGPKAPTNIIVIPGNTNIYLYWAQNSEIDLKKYKIYRSRKNTNSFSFIRELFTTNFSDLGLANNTNYYYRLKAVDYNNNESLYSRIVSTMPGTNPRPVIPIGLKAVPDNNLVNLSWYSNPENDIQGYLIWRSYDQYSFYSNITALVLSNTFTDNSAVNDIRYYYKIQAVDNIDQTNDGYSEIVSALPLTNSAPIKPTGLEVVVTGDSSVSIRWNPNPESDISGYYVYYKKDGGIIYPALLSTTPVNTKITGLDNGEKYIIWIIARDTIGSNSSSSDFVSAYPVPPIDDLVVKPSGTETGAVLLGWTSPARTDNLGHPKRSIVKYSSTPVESFNSFWKALLFCDTIAHAGGTIESLKVNNLGTGCPGYYFTVAAIYGDDQGISLSKSCFQNASQIVNYALGGTFRKAGLKVKVDLPAYIIPEEATAIIIKSYDDIIKSSGTSFVNSMNSANDKVNNHQGLNLINKGINNVYDITLLNSAGNPIINKNNFSGNIKVYIPFNDIGHDFIVDETETSGENINIQTLRMFWLNEIINEWAVIEDSHIDYVNNYVIADINHLTAFAPISNPPYSDLDNAAVYPNPAYSPGENNKIVFTKLTAKVIIRIYTIAGELVRIHEKNDNTDKWLWNGLNNGNEPAASGVYIYYLEDGKSQPAKGKIAIIR